MTDDKDDKVVPFAGSTFRRVGALAPLSGLIDKEYLTNLFAFDTNNAGVPDIRPLYAELQKAGRQAGYKPNVGPYGSALKAIGLLDRNGMVPEKACLVLAGVFYERRPGELAINESWRDLLMEGNVEPLSGHRPKGRDDGPKKPGKG